jgi:hypothetical protein
VQGVARECVGRDAGSISVQCVGNVSTEGMSGLCVYSLFLEFVGRDAGSISV